MGPGRDHARRDHNTTGIGSKDKIAPPSARTEYLDAATINPDTAPPAAIPA